MSLASEIAEHLLQIKAIKLSPQSPFTWASGIKSPIYCDNRVSLSYPSVRNKVKAGFVEKSKSFGPFDVVAGVATAGIPHGAMLADALGLPFIYVRSKPKSHGRQNLIEGELPEGAKVLVIEDLISTGGSSIQAVDALRESGAEVIGVLAIFTYGLSKADENFSKANCKFATLSDYDTLLEKATEIGYVEKDALETLQNWRKDPEHWMN
ncbi:MAG: orotate phosphoribosyltransferase [Saprospiraceae bacterium]|nr:orotate phosphoribosyltransferase [Saprospiraceae bacterium]